MSTIISGRYEIIEKLGQGGMGTVFKARHRDLDAPVALKLLPENLADDTDLVQRFKREARIMARLKHDNIVKVFDVAEDGKLYYLVEEYVEGPTLSDYVKRHGALSVGEALDIARQLAGALVYAHEQGVIHRDIKPTNVLVERAAPFRPKLVDFGIARIDDAAEHTQTGTILGSLKYSAPEQLGYRPPPHRTERLAIDGRADIYSLGLVIFEMCEGEQFFAGLEQQEILGKLLFDANPLTPTFTRSVPPHVIALVTRAICRDREGRHESMAELVKDIERSLRELARAPRGPVAAEHTRAGHESDAADAPTEVWGRTFEETAILPKGVEDRPGRAVDESTRRAQPPPQTPTPPPAPRPPTRTAEDERGRDLPNRAYLAVGGVAAIMLLAAGFYYLMPPSLAWRELSPPETEQHVQEGKSLPFRARAQHPDSSDTLRYVWLLDGRAQAEGTDWQYEASFGEGALTREVKVIASQSGTTIERTWHVHVDVAPRPAEVGAVAPSAVAPSKEKVDAMVPSHGLVEALTERLHNDHAPFDVTLRVNDTTQTEFPIGSRIAFDVTSDQSGYLLLFELDQANTINVLYPNAATPNVRIEGGRAITFPPGESNRLTLAAPAGQEIVKAIVSDQPLGLGIREALHGRSFATFPPGQDADPKSAEGFVAELEKALEERRWSDAHVVLRSFE